jgi:hypothetical protein
MRILYPGTHENMRLLMLTTSTTTGVLVEVVCSTHQPEAPTGEDIMSIAITQAKEACKVNIDLRDFKKNSEPFYAGVSQRKRGQKQKRKRK